MWLCTYKIFILYVSDCGCAFCRCRNAGAFVKAYAVVYDKKDMHTRSDLRFPQMLCVYHLFVYVVRCSIDLAVVCFLYTWITGN